MRSLPLIFVLFPVLIAGCAGRKELPVDPPLFSWVQSTRPESPMTGKASFWPAADGVKIRVVVTGAEPGKHGIHIHENGSCEDAGNAAGSHFNPDHVGHGLVTNDGFKRAHPGDLGNITVDPTGTGSTEVFVKGLTLDRGQYGIANRAVIIHEKMDDYSQPTGNAGSRIACAIIPSLTPVQTEEPKKETAPAQTETKTKKKRNPWLLWIV